MAQRKQSGRSHHGGRVASTAYCVLGLRPMPGPSTDVRPHVPCPETFKVLLRGIEISNGFVEASLLRVSQGNHVNASKLRFCVGYGPKLRDGTIVLPRKIKVHRV